jgi:uncharacterized Zn-binding protein involved in type VI secretion
MEKTIIRVGDANSSGGKVISGSADHTILGKAIARMGDKVDCPGVYPGGRPHGVNPIVEGVKTFTIHGIPVAVDGMKSECGCTLIGSGPATTHVEGGAVVASSATAQGWALVASPEMAMNADDGSQTSAHAEHEYGQQFKLVDHVSGQALSQRAYRIFCNGFATEGVTDADGLTAKVFASKATNATLYVEEMAHPPVNPDWDA